MLGRSHSFSSVVVVGMMRSMSSSCNNAWINKPLSLFPEMPEGGVPRVDWSDSRLTHLNKLLAKREPTQHLADEFRNLATELAQKLKPNMERWLI